MKETKAEQLRTLIQAAGITQREAAERLAKAIKEPVPLRTLQQWLGGQREPSGFVMYTAKKVIK